MEVDKNSNVQIDELIGFLYRYDKEKIKSLKEKYPGHLKIFDLGIQLGSNGQDELFIRAESCKIALESIVKKCEEVIPILKNKIRRLNLIQLTNQIVVATGGASILGLIQSEGFEIIKYMAAALVLLGSLVNIYFQFASNSLLPDSNSFFKDYNLIIDCNINSQKCIYEIETILKISEKSEEDKKELRVLINKGNEFAYELKKCLLKIL